MRAPIIVNNRGDVMVFDSVEDAAMYLEPVDVDNREYTAYDAGGRLLELSATPTGVTISSAEPVPTHSEALRHLLIEFLAGLGLSREMLADASLHELIARGLQYKVR